MTEDDAIAWLIRTFGARAIDPLRDFVAAVVAETTRQNLIAPSTVSTIWARHVVDSAQLLTLAPPGWRRWLDIGTGGGFPGMIVAILAPDRETIMAEPRQRRAAFLERCVGEFGLSNATVIADRVEKVGGPMDVISARAVAPVANLLALAQSCAGEQTTWLLPRGRSGAAETADPVTRMFHVEHSFTDAESVILVAKGRSR